MKESLTHTRIWAYLTERGDINDTTTKHSQYGNNIFPAWEQFIPNVGTIRFFMLVASPNLYSNDKKNKVFFCIALIFS